MMRGDPDQNVVVTMKDGKIYTVRDEFSHPSCEFIQGNKIALDTVERFGSLPKEA